MGFRNPEQTVSIPSGRKWFQDGGNSTVWEMGAGAVAIPVNRPQNAALLR